MEEQKVDRLFKEELSYGEPIEPAPEPLRYPPMVPQWEPYNMSFMLTRLWGAFLFGFVPAWLLFWREEQHE
jgi:hypothetical protein